MHLLAKQLHILYLQRFLWLHELLLLLLLVVLQKLKVTHCLHGILSCCLRDTFTDYSPKHLTNTNWSDIIFLVFEGDEPAVYKSL